MSFDASIRSPSVSVVSPSSSVAERTTARSIAAASTNKTYRVENIPAGFTKEELLDCFDDLDRPHVLIRSLAPAITEPATNPEELTATITLTGTDKYSDPPELLDEDIWVDDEFLGFTPLNWPKDPTVADIIAIPGIDCHAFESWAASTKQMWLRDALPKDTPSARVLLYGYDSQPQSHRSGDILSDYVQDLKMRLLNLHTADHDRLRPVIFVAHSIGSLILKRALVELYETSPRKCLPFDVPCIVFLGAPHRGLNHDALATLVSSQSPRETARELGVGATNLEDLNEAFSKISKYLDVLTCYESRDTPISSQGGRAMLVDRDAATLHSERETCVPCPGNHWQIAKLTRSQAGNYSTVKSHISRAIAVLQRPTGDTDKVFDITSMTPTPLSAVDKEKAAFNAPQSNAPKTWRPLQPPDNYFQKPQQQPVPVYPHSPPPSFHRNSDQSLPRVESPTLGQRNRFSPSRFSSTSTQPQSDSSSVIEAVELPPEGSPPIYEMPGDRSSKIRANSVRSIYGGPTSSGPNPAAAASSDLLRANTERERHVHFNPPTSELPAPVERPDRSLSESKVVERKHPERRTRTTRHGPRGPHRRTTLDQVMSKVTMRRTSNDVQRPNIPDVSPWFDAIMRNDLAGAKEHYANGADPSAHNDKDYDRTALHYAAQRANPIMLKWLLDNKAKKNARDHGEQTPLHDAAAVGATECIQILLDAGAHRDVRRSSDNKTPLRLAFESRQKGAYRALHGFDFELIVVHHRVQLSKNDVQLHGCKGAIEKRHEVDHPPPPIMHAEPAVEGQDPVSFEGSEPPDRRQCDDIDSETLGRPSAKMT